MSGQGLSEPTPSSSRYVGFSCTDSKPRRGNCRRRFERVVAPLGNWLDGVLENVVSIPRYTVRHPCTALVRRPRGAGVPLSGYLDRVQTV